MSALQPELEFMFPSHRLQCNRGSQSNRPTYIPTCSPVLRLITSYRRTLHAEPLPHSLAPKKRYHQTQAYNRGIRSPRIDHCCIFQYYLVMPHQLTTSYIQSGIVFEAIPPISVQYRGHIFFAREHCLMRASPHLQHGDGR